MTLCTGLCVLSAACCIRGVQLSKKSLLTVLACAECEQARAGGSRLSPSACRRTVPCSPPATSSTADNCGSRYIHGLCRAQTANVTIVHGRVAAPLVRRSSPACRLHCRRRLTARASSPAAAGGVRRRRRARLRLPRPPAAAPHPPSPAPSHLELPLLLRNLLRDLRVVRQLRDHRPRRPHVALLERLLRRALAPPEVLLAPRPQLCGRRRRARAGRLGTQARACTPRSAQTAEASGTPRGPLARAHLSAPLALRSRPPPASRAPPARGRARGSQNSPSHLHVSLLRRRPLHPQPRLPIPAAGARRTCRHSAGASSALCAAHQAPGGLQGRRWSPQTC